MFGHRCILHPWLQKALLIGKRPFGLEVPASGAAHMCCTTVHDQELCEIQNISHNPLQGKALVSLCALESVCVAPLGAYAARDPRLEVAARRMRWLHMRANQVVLVTTVHRQLTYHSGKG